MSFKIVKQFQFFSPNHGRLRWCVDAIDERAGAIETSEGDTLDEAIESVKAKFLFRVFQLAR